MINFLGDIVKLMKLEQISLPKGGVIGSRGVIEPTKGNLLRMG